MVSPLHKVLDSSGLNIHDICCEGVGFNHLNMCVHVTGADASSASTAADAQSGDVAEGVRLCKIRPHLLAATIQYGRVRSSKTIWCT
eukprot:3238147-Amphidinium_carterae.1